MMVALSFMAHKMSHFHSEKDLTWWRLAIPQNAEMDGNGLKIGLAAKV